jgi:hypothetical protein
MAQVTEKRNACMVLVVEPGGKGLVRKVWWRWEDTTKMYFK